MAKKATGIGGFRHHGMGDMTSDGHGKYAVSDGREDSLVLTKGGKSEDSYV